MGRSVCVVWESKWNEFPFIDFAGDGSRVYSDCCVISMQSNK